MKAPYIARVGGVPSADIAVPQHERVLQFYSHVLCTGENPLWRKDLMNNQGLPIIGLGKQSPEYPDLPLQWMPHIQVADIAQSVKCALDLGGSEVYHGKDEDGMSQWALLLDPNGTAFGLIPVLSESDIPPMPEATSEQSFGCIAWLDLTVTNASIISDFYQKVIGWSVQDINMQDKSNTEFKMLGGDGNPAAAVRQAGGANLDLPSIWMLYLPVGDLAESLRRVREEGGQIIRQSTESNGRAYAVIEDPVGVSIALTEGQTNL
jgi:predicted enzyme related to lactoylglutathione lyase